MWTCGISTLSIPGGGSSNSNNEIISTTFVCGHTMCCPLCTLLLNEDFWEIIWKETDFFNYSSCVWNWKVIWQVWALQSASSWPEKVTFLLQRTASPAPPWPLSARDFLVPCPAPGSLWDWRVREAYFISCSCCFGITLMVCDFAFYPWNSVFQEMQKEKKNPPTKNKQKTGICIV